MITFRVGDKGQNLRQDVLIVQILLKTKGYNPGPIDGICGQETNEAIRKFQSTFLKKPDGIVEPNRATWLKLSSISSVPIPNLMQWSGDSAQWPQEKKILSMTPICGQKSTPC